jgi:excisionase family DNA binding protein
MYDKMTNATGGRIAGHAESGRSDAALLDVREVAKLLKCSTRHVYRLCDINNMPHPLRLGSLVRWSRTTIENWIANGCPSNQKGVAE